MDNLDGQRLKQGKPLCPPTAVEDLSGVQVVCGNTPLPKVNLLLMPSYPSSTWHLMCFLESPEPSARGDHVLPTWMG